VIVLVDTSVWVDHFRRHNASLAALLDEGAVLMHPFVIGELACGNLKNRAITLEMLALLPHAARATDFETLRLITNSRLYGRGIGWIDAHLAAAALLSDCALWTLDERLRQAASSAGVTVHRA
jgi:predicted nucleic acid-binding protein